MSDKIAEAQKVRTTTVCDADETKRDDDDDGAVVDTAEETFDRSIVESRVGVSTLARRAMATH